MSGSEKDLKAGHAPAEMIGGRRVGQRRISGGDHKEEKTATEFDESGAEVVAKSPPKGEKYQEVTLSGDNPKLQVGSTKEDAKHFHNKQPLPTIEKRPPQVIHNIHQPR